MIAELTLVAAIASCESLASLKLQNATITIAQPVEAGQFTAPEAEAAVVLRPTRFNNCRRFVTSPPL
jgi:hypothetical protein